MVAVSPRHRGVDSLVPTIERGVRARGGIRTIGEVLIEFLSGEPFGFSFEGASGDVPSPDGNGLRRAAALIEIAANRR